jgi:hypothetical protein
MPQGFASAPACWDEAMSRIFSSKTMQKIKAMLDQEEADQLPDSFDDFFTYYQDDSWIFSDTDEIHLLQSAQKNLAGLWQCTAPKPFEIGTPNFLGILLWSLIRSGRNFIVLPHENSPLRSI